MSIFDDIGRAISRPIKHAARDVYNSDVAKGVSRAVKHTGAAINKSPVAMGVLTAATVASGGVLAPLALGVSAAGLIDNVSKHGPVEGLRQTASEEMANKNPNGLLAAAMKQVPDSVKNSNIQKMIGDAVKSIPKGKISYADIQKAQRFAMKDIMSGKDPKAVIQAAAKGLALAGGEALEHASMVQSAMNKLPSAVRRDVANALNATTKLHDAVQRRIRAQAETVQRTGLFGYLIPIGGKKGAKYQGKWQFKAGGVRGLLLTADGRIRLGYFAKV